MPAARTDSPTSTKSPTRSSVQVNCLRCAIFSFLPFGLPTAAANSYEKPFQILIFRIGKLFLPALEINAAGAQNQKTRGRHLCGGCRIPVGHAVHDPFRSRVETEIRQRETVLDRKS